MLIAVILNINKNGNSGGDGDHIPHGQHTLRLLML